MYVSLPQLCDDIALLFDNHVFWNNLNFDLVFVDIEANSNTFFLVLKSVKIFNRIMT